MLMLNIFSMSGSSSDFHSEEDFPEVKTVFQVNFFHRDIISNFADIIRDINVFFIFKSMFLMLVM